MMGSEFMDKKIIWEKWVDPMGVGDDDEFLPEKDYLNDFEKGEQIDREGREGVVYKARPAAITSFGFIPINSYNDPAKAFDFWIGHTNFYIGNKTKDIIDNTPGVEIFDIFGPYRFRIAVGKAFKFKDVRVAIEARLMALNIKQKAITESTINLDPNLRTKVIGKISELKEDNSYWIVYVLPNSEMEISLPKDLETFQKRKNILDETRQLAGGILISSEDFGV
jgi:hypothetical protein